MPTPAPRDPIAPPPAPARSGIASALPWLIAVGALVVLVVVFAARAPAPTRASMAPTVAPSSRPPDLANMSPSERASRLYVRVMQYAEAGMVDSVTMFMPMALAAHDMLDSPTIDERYHLGRVSEIVGRSAVVTAQADSILRESPRSLLGLLLAARGARMKDDRAATRAFDQRLLAALDAELATDNPDYEGHRLEIELAVSEARHR